MTLTEIPLYSPWFENKLIWGDIGSLDAQSKFKRVIPKSICVHWKWNKRVI